MTAIVEIKIKDCKENYSSYLRAIWRNADRNIEVEPHVPPFENNCSGESFVSSKF